MNLPDCLTKLDHPEVRSTPALFYDVIVSRPSGGVQVTDTTIIAWSSVSSTRCFLTLKSLNEYIEQKFLVCVLREFDRLP